MQANGLDEHFNQTLQGMLVKFVGERKAEWSTLLDTCTFTYNTSQHSSTKFIPFELMFGRKATLAYRSGYLQAHSPGKTLSAPTSTGIGSSLHAAQKKQKELYDRKHGKHDGFKVGGLVLRENFRRKKTKGGKLADRYLGRYEILKVSPVHL